MLNANMLKICLFTLLAVHTSGAIRPATTHDAKLKCGSVLCEQVTELYDTKRPPLGYNYVATIPVGAMNFSVKQQMPCDNLLTLKSTDDIYLMNANHKASESGIFEFNDDVYDYNRELGLIAARGPLSKPIILLLFVLGDNPGVAYNYTIPVPSATVTEEEELQTHWDDYGNSINETEIENSVDSTVAAQLARGRERKRRKFTWKLLGFGPCSRTCGPGLQTPIFRCVRDVATRYYSPKRCALAEKPTFLDDIYSCNRGMCPPYWRLGNYSDCNCTASAVEGLRRRNFKCVQEQIKGGIEDVDDSHCANIEKAPQLQEVCECPTKARRKMYAAQMPRVYSRLLSAPVQVRSVYNSSTSLRRHLRDNGGGKAGTWLMSGWHGQCRADACSADGIEVRSIYCDRTPPKSELCDLRFTPEQKRACPEQEVELVSDCRQGEWFATEWSKCTGDCFALQRRRTVVCLLDGQVALDEHCVEAIKPSRVKSCMLKEVDYCGPQWHYSEWSECSRTCGEGIQRRYAKCLDYDWKMNSLVESNNCKYLEREPVYGTCRGSKCEEDNPAANAIDRDSEASSIEDLETSGPCTDEFRNCQRINRQLLCRLQYYRTYCCQTCRGHV